MLISLEDMFSDQQSIATSASGSVASINTLDWGKKGNEAHYPLHVFCKATSAGTGSITVKVQTSDNNSAWEDVIVGTPKANFAAGDMLLEAPLPHGLGRYVRMLYVINSASSAPVTIQSGIVRDGVDIEHDTVKY